LDQKRYRSFKISKDIVQEAFQLGLLEEWAIHNIFNKNLLIQCRKPQFKGQHMDSVPSLNIINNKEEYKMEEVRNQRK